MNKTLDTFYKKPEKSANEQMKIDSKYLAGDIANELADDSTKSVSDYSYELLKFHGTYQGFNRDTSTARKKEKQEPDYEFMVRIRLPGGRMTPAQYLAMDELAHKHANGTIRVTTRQTFQFHVIEKKNLKAAIHDINLAMLSTLSACGDVVRNVTTSPAPIKDAKHAKLLEDSYKIAEFCTPKTTGYDEIWNDKKESNREIDNAEPLYGKTYLPRKFKIGVTLPEDNAADVFTHDLGVVLIYEGEVFKGYQLMIGGGMGMNHEPGKDQKATYPRVANEIAFIAPDDLLKAVEAIVKFQRDFGDRTDRKHARLKYVVEELGLDFAIEKFHEYFNALNPSAPAAAPIKGIKYKIKNHLGWHEQGDGKLYLGVPIASGRIMDYGEGKHESGYNSEGFPLFENTKYMTGFREFVKKYNLPITLTPDQKIIFCDIEPSQKSEIEAFFGKYNIPLKEAHTPMMQHFHTCVSLPTCAKALAESERVQFQMMYDVQKQLDKHGISNEQMSVRVTGCPNGCSRPFVGDIGIVGRMPGAYVIFIGGDTEGTRLNTKVFDKVPLEHLGTVLEPMFEKFSKEKNQGEKFGDFCHRVGSEIVAKYAEEKLAPQNFAWAKLVA
jgi:sulfite reductase (ferredoxin)